MHGHSLISYSIDVVKMVMYVLYVYKKRKKERMKEEMVMYVVQV
jgi:hypothetical protein